MLKPLFHVPSITISRCIQSGCFCNSSNQISTVSDVPETNWNSISILRYSVLRTKRQLWRFHLLLSNIAQLKYKFVEELPLLNIIYALSYYAPTNLVPSWSHWVCEFAKFQLRTQRTKFKYPVESRSSIAESLRIVRLWSDFPKRRFGDVPNLLLMILGWQL